MNSPWTPKISRLQGIKMEQALRVRATGLTSESIAQNDEEAGADGGNGTRGTKYAFIVSVLEAVLILKTVAMPKELIVLMCRVVTAARVTSVTPVAGVPKTFLVLGRSLAPSLEPASLPMTVKGNPQCTVLTDSEVQLPAQSTGLSKPQPC